MVFGECLIFFNCAKMSIAKLYSCVTWVELPTAGQVLVLGNKGNLSARRHEAH